MEARTEVKTDIHGGSGLCRYGLDGILDCGYEDDCPEDLGSLQYIEHLEGMHIGHHPGHSANTVTVS